MPEIAEVRLISDTLEHFLKGKRLRQLRIKDPVRLAKWVNRCCPNLAELNAKLSPGGVWEEGLLVNSVQTRGKFSWVDCTAGGLPLSIGIHYGMSGNIRPEPTTEFLSTYRWKGKTVTREEFMKHCIIALEYTDGIETNSVQSVYYHDIRRFGRFEVFWTPAELQAKLQKLGHDPLSQPALPDSELIQRFRLHNHKNICKLLMGQELLAGVGNYIKSETLYSAHISPNATVSDIPDSALLALYKAIRSISWNAYESGGATLYTYTGVQGDQTEFKGTLKVYGKGGELDENGHIIQRMADNVSPDRRTTFWVPEIQTIGQSPPAPTAPTAHVPVPVPVHVPAAQVPVTVKLLKPLHPPPRLIKVISKGD